MTRSLNISGGGIFVRTQHPLALNQVVRVRFTLPGITHKFECNGTVVWANVMATAIREAGALTGFVGTVEDITERKRAEAALRESEERFRATFENAPVGIMHTSIGDNRILQVNPKLCEMLGYSLEEMRNLKVADLHPEKDLPYVLDQFERQSRGEFSLGRDIPLKRRDGSVFCTEVNSSVLTFRRKTYLMGIFRDLTERQRAEQEINASNQKLRRALRGAARVPRV